MKSREAFATLLAAVEAALEESLARHKSATQQGDFDTMEVELERQKNLVSARQQLEGLQELWPRLVGEHRLAKKPRGARRATSRRKRLPRGAKTPQQAFVLPILSVLEDLGGSGAAVEVLDRVGELMSDKLNKFDLSALRTGQPRWRNTAQWTRQEMKNEGLLADDSPRGVWEITEYGRAFLRERSATQQSSLQSRESGQRAIAAEGQLVFARYKARRFEAVLLPNHRVIFNGEEYLSPSGAAMAIVDWKSVNGWKFWYYLDEKGREHTIDTLR